jgi:sec-independent protein translocase protein TatB
VFGIGGWELVVILALALLVLGPRRLPAAARAFGRGLQTLRRATVDLRRSIELDPEMEDLPRTLDELGRPLVPPISYGAASRSRRKPDQDLGQLPAPSGRSGVDGGAAPPDAPPWEPQDSALPESEAAGRRTIGDEKGRAAPPEEHRPEPESDGPGEEQGP